MEGSEEKEMTTGRYQWSYINNQDKGRMWPAWPTKRPLLATSPFGWQLHLIAVASRFRSLISACPAKSHSHPSE